MSQSTAAATGSGSSGSGGSAASSVPDERRIWVGNLDGRLSEYQLLKILQKCGPIEKFDMLFHKGGPLVGQSRGYAFVTFTTAEGAVSALERLNGTLVANRPIAVRLAKNVTYDDLDRPKPRIEIPALGTGKREGKISKEETIRAIENKLKMLERHGDDDLELNTSGSGSYGAGGQQVPFIQRYQFNKDRDANSSAGNQRGGRTYSGPYNRNQRPKRR